MRLEFEINKELLKNLIRSHVNFAVHEDCTILGCFHFELVGDALKISTTDGLRLLKSTIKVENLSKENGTFNIFYKHIEKLPILPSDEANFYVMVDDKHATFTDKSLGLDTQYVLILGKYPDTAAPINLCNYKNKNHQINVNKKLFENFSALYFDKFNPIVELNFNKEDNSKPILVKNICKDVKQFAVLMPAAIKK